MKKRNNIIKFKWTEELGFGEMKCPSCDNMMKFERGGSIIVKCESTRSIEVPKLIVLTQGCENPFCKWSRIEGKSL